MWKYVCYLLNKNVFFKARIENKSRGGYIKFGELPRPIYYLYIQKKNKNIKDKAISKKNYKCMMLCIILNKKISWHDKYSLFVRIYLTYLNNPNIL